MADGEVRVLSTGLVQAAGQTKPSAAIERIPLTPCDLRLILLGTIQKGLLFHKPTNPQFHQTTFIQTLKSSFSLALASFYPLAGRLSVDKHPDDDDGTASVYIDCNNAGALFAHALADGVSISDILDPLYVPPVLGSLFPLNWLRSYHGFSEPFFAVQVTELTDGIFIGCTVSHAVVDGTTFWRFMNFWSQISRSGGSYSANKSPIFTRPWFLDEKHLPIRIPWTMVKDCFKEDFVLPPVKERVFHFSREKLAALKAQANAEATTDTGKIISSLQSLISHIWRAVIRNRKTPDPDRESIFGTSIGLRSRLEPKFPENYFGNAIVGTLIALKQRDLLLPAEKGGLGHVAAEVNKMVAGQTDEKLKQAMETWIEDPKFPMLGQILAAGTVVMLGSSPRYDVYGNDFGWGKPVAVRSGPGSKLDGKLMVFPGVEEGSMDVEICLSPEAAERLGSDVEFMAAVGV